MSIPCLPLERIYPCIELGTSLPIYPNHWRHTKYGLHCIHDKTTSRYSESCMILLYHWNLLPLCIIFMLAVNSWVAWELIHHTRRDASRYWTQLDYCCNINFCFPPPFARASPLPHMTCHHLPSILYLYSSACMCKSLLMKASAESRNV